MRVIFKNGLVTCTDGVNYYSRITYELINDKYVLTEKVIDERF